MATPFIEDFLAHFDDSRFPEDFLRRYELMECLSDNEMGETLLVKDRQTGTVHVAKCCADKSLHSHSSESDLLKGLHHPGLPTYTGEYQNEKMLCVVRSYVPGTPLDQLVQAQRLTRQQSITIAVQLCEILIYLHGQTPPIIHRDIKPQNIIVNEQGKVALIDFGTSRLYDETAQKDTVHLGTRYYAAPEQYGFSQTDCRTDIYSLGILLCWLLTGTIEVQKAMMLIPDPSLVKIIKKCTAFDPKNRYQHAAQVRDALTARPFPFTNPAIFFAPLIILVSTLFFVFSKSPFPSRGIAFKEPLIEEAVRLALGKDETETILEQDLLSISELLVFGQHAAASEDRFRSHAESFVNNDGTVVRGDIDALDDLIRLKNLRRIALVYQNISDLTPLSELGALESIDLRHNPITDVAPLSEISSLTSLSLFDTHVSDLTALRSCTLLNSLDVGKTQIRSTSALNGLDSLQVLIIRRTPLQSLDQIETHPRLEQISLSETQIFDLSPLLDLLHLQRVEVDETMRTAAEAIAEQARFTFIYP